MNTKHYSWPPQDLGNFWLQTNSDPQIQKLYKEYQKELGSAAYFEAHFYSVLAFAFTKNKILGLNLTPEHFDQLFDNCPPVKHGLWSAEALITLAHNNKKQELNLRQDQIDRVVAATDVNFLARLDLETDTKNIRPATPLSAIFFGNNSQNLNIKKPVILDIMEKTDYTKERYYLLGIINNALTFNQNNQLDFTTRDWEFLIHHAKLSSPPESVEKHHCVLTLFATLPKHHLLGQLSFSQIDFIVKDAGLNVREIEKLPSDEKKLEFLLNALTENTSIPPELYKTKIIQGYHIYKEEKLKQLAIEEEKELLAEAVSMSTQPQINVKTSGIKKI